MAALLGHIVIVSLLSITISAYGIGERLPTQTVGYGEPHLVVPTEAPSWDKFLDLVKVKRQVVTNACTEWTLLGAEGGQPACTGSSTCVFNQISGHNYEACALTSASYSQITTCYEWASAYVNAQEGELYCDETAPYCGTFEFVFGNGNTYSNYGCSNTRYAATAVLLPGAMSSFTDVSALIITTGAPTSTEQPSTIVNTTPANQPPPTSITQSNSHSDKQKKLISMGAVIGAVVGGVAFIVMILGLIGCCIYRRRRAAEWREQEQQQANAATLVAYRASQHNSNHENALGIGMSNKSGHNDTFIHNSNEKSTAAVYMQEQEHEQEYDYNRGQSPPPTYNQPSPNLAAYTELSDDARLDAATPISAMYPPSPVGGLSPRPQSMVQELSSVNYPQTSPVVEQPARRQHTYIDMNGAPMSERYHDMR